MDFTRVDMTVAGRYRVDSPIGAGSFGDIYKGRDLETNESVAIKMEAIDAKNPQLRYEAKLYRTFAGSFGVPSVHWFGKQDSNNVMVFDLLGPSLHDLLDSCGGRFSLKTVLLLADQMINRLEWLHSRNFLHRDIKPDNFAVGIGDKANVIHLIDFGLCKKFRDQTLAHIPYREGKRMIGTLRYASLQAHLGIEQGRRDDLESLGYVLMYFLRGNLPWQGLSPGSSRESITENLLKCKMSTPVEKLCDGFPIEFAVYLNTCKQMRFQEKPDYSYLKGILRDVFVREGYCRDFIFDWSAADLDRFVQLGKHEIEDKSELGERKWSAQSSPEEEVSTRTPSSLATNAFSLSLPA
jgi:casein kinase I family protein HRR25